MSLLAGLAGVTVLGPIGTSGAPAQGSGRGLGSAGGGEPVVATSGRGGPSSVPAPTAISLVDLEAWLDHEVSRPVPDPALAEQLTAARLTVRSRYLLLFEAVSRGWARHRAVAWEALVAAPSQGPGVLSMYTQARSWPPAGYAAPAGRSLVAYLTTPDGGSPSVDALGQELELYRGTATRVPRMDGLTISGLAQRAGVGVETVRFYERRGLLNRPGGSARRRYTEESAHRLGLIRRAKGLGFTLAEIRDLLDAADGGAAEDILGAARVKLGQVEAELRALRATRCRLTRLVNACAAGEHSCVVLQVDTPPSIDGPVALEEAL